WHHSFAPPPTLLSVMAVLLGGNTARNFCHILGVPFKICVPGGGDMDPASTPAPVLGHPLCGALRQHVQVVSRGEVVIVEVVGVPPGACVVPGDCVRGDRR